MDSKEKTGMAAAMNNAGLSARIRSPDTKVQPLIINGGGVAEFEMNSERGYYGC